MLRNVNEVFPKGSFWNEASGTKHLLKFQTVMLRNVNAVLPQGSIS
ncbi:hypothetical protein [Dulcicalothrix desertica]|nr:hypothetical protein [Dulcicalothrix desertica]